MLQQRRSSRRFVLSELQRTNKSLLPDDYDGTGGSDEDVPTNNFDEDGPTAVTGDSDDPDDGFCIQLEPMSAPAKSSGAAKNSLPPMQLPRPRRSSFAVMSLYDRDEPPPTKNEIAQWKSIKNLKNNIT